MSASEHYFQHSCMWVCLLCISSVKIYFQSLSLLLIPGRDTEWSNRKVLLLGNALECLVSNSCFLYLQLFSTPRSSQGSTWENLGADIKALSVKGVGTLGYQVDIHCSLSIWLVFPDCQTNPAGLLRIIAYST